MSKENKAIDWLKNDFDKNVFVMMRYRDNPKFTELELVIRESLDLYGLKARLAKDKAYCDEIWDNIKTYMENSKYGVVVFEEIDEREYNPNISMELGYMYALGSRCLLLKDKRMPTLPTDICGKIYRNFDTYNIKESVSEQINEWCEKDLGLEKIEQNKIHRTELDIYISENYESLAKKFDKRPSWEEYISIVLREHDGEETTYYIWNEKSEKIYKYYKYGVSWDGPHNLNKDDESKIKMHIEESNNASINQDEIWETDNFFYAKNIFLDDVTWDHADEYAKNLKIDDFVEWSLPTLEDLKLIRSKRKELNIAENNCYWSSERKGKTDAFYVHFDDGHVGNAPRTFSNGVCGIFIMSKRLDSKSSGLNIDQLSDISTIEVIVLDELRNKPDVLWNYFNIEDSIKINHPEYKTYISEIQGAINNLIHKGYLRIDENKSISITAKAIQYYRKFPRYELSKSE